MKPSEELRSVIFQIHGQPDEGLSDHVIAMVEEHCRGDTRQWVEAYLLGYYKGYADGHDEGEAMKSDSVAHSIRFRSVSNRYPRRVAEAYNGDIAAAARDDDATVAERVRQWEIARGLEPRDWIAIGHKEGRS